MPFHACRRSIFQSVALLALLIGAPACTVFNATPSYVAPAANLPTLPGVGTADVGFSIGSNGAEVQAAVAPTTNILLTGQVHNYRADAGRDAFWSYEGGFGTYAWRPSGVLLACYMGTGAGGGRAEGYTSRYGFGSSGDSVGRASRTRFTSQYVLPMIGWRSPSGVLEGAVGLKVSAVQFSRLQLTETRSDQRYVADSLGFGSYQTFRTTEFTDRSGSTRAHVQVVSSLSAEVAPRLRLTGRFGVDLDASSNLKPFEVRPLIITLGLTCRLGKAYQLDRRPPQIRYW